MRRLLLAGLFLTAGISAAAAEPVHGRSKELGIRFALAGGSDWCNATVVVRLRAGRASVYQPDDIPFLKMAGRIRAIINAQCPTVERILYVGFVKRRKVFAAEMTKLTRWRRFISLDPDTEAPTCAGAQDDGECDKRAAAYTMMTQVLTGPAFADVELTSVMEDRTDLHAGWRANEAFGALKLRRRSEHEGRDTDNAALAEANIADVEEACSEKGGQALRIPSADYGEPLTFRSVLCQRPGEPSLLNIVLVTTRNDWFYLFSLWGEEPNMAPANTMATALAEALLAIR